MSEDKLLSLARNLLRANKIRFDAATQSYFLAEDLELSLGFENIAIKQKKNICESRLAVKIESEIIKGIKRPIPLIAANMSTVCNADFCILLNQLGALGVMHRASDEGTILKEISKIKDKSELVAASIGVGDEQFTFAEKLIDHGCNIIFIDIAHGYSQSVINLAYHLKHDYPGVKVVIGNTTNVGLLEETHAFVDGIKVGIAQGFACETKNTAGCTEKQFSAVLKFKDLARELKVPIISDGGIREPADLTKAIAAGANSIMAGKIFAACPESAAEVLEINGKLQKIYAGMASRYVQNRWRGGLKDGTCPEGGVRYLDIGESVEKLLERYSGALRSGITYGGGQDIRSFQDNVEFVRLS